MNRLMRRRIAVLILLGLPFFHVAAFPAAASAAVGGIVVNVLPLPSPVGGGRNSLQHGRIEYRVQLKNTAKENRVVHLQIPAPAAYRADAGTIVSRTVPIAAGQEAIESLFQFPEVYDGTMEVRVDGVHEKETMSVGTITRAYNAGEAEPPTVLLSRSVSLDFCRLPLRAASKEELPAPETPAGPAGPTARGPAMLQDVFTFFHSELPLAQWSPNWLGYSCFDVVVLTAKDVDQMPAEVQLAVRRYLECGGTLLVHGEKVPAVFSQNALGDGAGGYLVGRGHAVASGAKTEAKWDKAALKFGTRSLVNSICSYEHRKPADRHNLLVAESRVPVRGMFALVLLFAVGIGPANLWLLTRYKRRIWLWWNVPAISLLTCLAVFGYSVFSEGWRGHAKTASMTLLDQRTHRATTFGYASYYCPLTPFSGPRFGAETDVTLADEQSSPYRPEPYGRARENLDARYVDWSGDQQFATGWVRARVPAYFPFRKNEDRRERLNFSMNGSTPSVVNALGADIDRLYWADASGKVFAGHDIAAGAEKSLVASAEAAVLPAQGSAMHKELFAASAVSDLLTLIDSCQSEKMPSRWLVPGTYIAYLKKSPFVEAGLEGVSSEDTAAIVYGLCEVQENGR